MPELLPPQVQQLLHIFVEVIDVPYTLPAIWFGYSLGASLTPYP